MTMRKKIISKRYLYEVTLDGGKNNKDYWRWLENVREMNAKEPDYGGIQNLCLLSHSQDAGTVHMLATQGFSGADSDVTVTEITRETLDSTDSAHRMYTDLVERYFLPYNSYPNIDE